MVLGLLQDPRRKFPVQPIVESGCEDKVFRTGDGAILLGAHGLPATPPPWTYEPTPDFVDVSPEEARLRVLEGHGLLVNGCPGTGKTFWAKGLIRELRENKQVRVLAKCHVAVQNIEGDCTADHFVHKYIRNGSCSAHTLCLEEISQLDVGLWGELSKLALIGKTFLCLGDFQQFSAIGNQWRGQKIREDALEKSSMLRELCPYRLTLTQNMRSDPVLFEWYSSLIPHGPRFGIPLPDVLTEVRRAFPRKPGHPKYTLCVSHRRRMTVNRQQNAKEAFNDQAVFIPAAAAMPGDLNLPQDFWCFPGQELVGCCRGCGPIKNGCFYRVKAVSAARVTIDGMGDIVLTHKLVSKNLRLTHGLTLAGCQGLTLSGRVRIVESGNPHFSRKHLYVGMSRATGSDLLEIC